MAHIFIGVGGTGNNVLKKLGEKINSNYRLISQLKDRPEVVFWLIDCDEMPSISGIPVIRTSLQVLNPENAQDFDLESDPEFKKWFDPNYRTKGHINGKDSPGAGQIKMSGRYAYHYEIAKIQKDRDRLLSEPGIDFAGARVHIISSLMGGTGAGMIYDVAYLMKQKAPDINLYILEPSFLRISDAGRKNYYSWNSAYASLVELDFWMSKNSKKTDHQQFEMKYKNNIHISGQNAPGYPAFVFGGTDQFGRSLAATGKQVFDTYQEFIASVLFERAFNDEFSRYLQKNILDNLEGKLTGDPSGHSRAFGGFGISYLRFPREKLHEYFKYELTGRLILPKFLKSLEDNVKLSNDAEFFMSQKVGVAEKENKQLTNLILDTDSVRDARSACDARIKKIVSAKNNKEIPRELPKIDFDKIENEITLLLDAIYKGRKILSKDSEKHYEGFVNLLEKKIFDMLVENSYLPDIIGLIKQIKAEADKDRSYLEKYYSPIIDQFHKKNLEEEIKKLNSKLFSTKQSLFSSKEFNRAKHNFINCYREYIEAKIIISWHRHAVELLEKISNETKKWIRTLEYIKEIVSSVIMGGEIKIRETLSKFKEGLFVYDKVLGDKNYVFELHIGDVKSILNSGLIKSHITDPIQDQMPKILDHLMVGDQKVPGINSLIKEIYKTSEEELNERSGEYQQKCESLFEKYAISEIRNKVDSIGLKEVLDWQLNEIYSLVKTLEDNKRFKREEYEKLIGKMNAMFGNSGTLNLIKDLDKIKSDEWKENAKAHLILNIKSAVNPLWKITESGKNAVMKQWYYIIFPQNMQIPENIRTGEDEQNSQWHNDRIVFLNITPGIRLNELEDLDEFKDIYVEQMKLKHPPNPGNTPPLFSDYRFYTEWEWDLDKDVTQQADTKTLQSFSFAMVLNDQENVPLILRKKAKSGYGFWYKPDGGFKGKEETKLGDGLAKSYESLNKDTELKQHFRTRFSESLNKEIFSVPENQRFNKVLETIQKVQREWSKLKPPEISEGRTIKSGGNSVSRAYFYWKKTSDWLSELAEKTTNQNYRELLF